MLLSRELHVSCSSSCGDVEYNVLITLLHTHTQKKICTCYVRLVVVTKREGCYMITIKERT
jgi:hypothetical protein